jgi:two-component system repressor protein LuxO
MGKMRASAAMPMSGKLLPVEGERPTVLLIEDNSTLVDLYSSYLADEPIQLMTAGTGRDAILLINMQTPHVVLLDLLLPDMNGLDILGAARASGSAASFVVITAHGSVQRAVEAMQAGAEDFLVKPFDKNRLLVTVANLIEKQRLARLVQNYREQERVGLDRMMGRSLPMQGVYRTVECAAPSQATVFVTGASGTGKELCAEAIHRLSPRRAKPFVAINCAAIPRGLLESELFGHVAGAFTGATKDRAGAAAQADGGTLFLDEICELDFDLQAKLLRFIQLGTFRRVGGSRDERADIRFVCATNRDPIAEVAANRFREDLYYRLHVIPIAMPPLRERGEDILDLARHFLERFARREKKDFVGFDNHVEQALARYPWPGNVRELENVVQQIVVLNSGGIVTLAMLPLFLQRSPVDEDRIAVGDQRLAVVRQDASFAAALPSASGAERDVMPLWQVERQAIIRTLAVFGGDIQKAAVALEISASTIYRKLQAWQTPA